MGTYLIDHVKKIAAQHDYTRILIEVNEKDQELIDWYAQKGFEKTKDKKSYYGPENHAIQMQFRIMPQTEVRKTNNIIVINKPFSWHGPEMNAMIISVKEYISNELYQNNPNFRIFNLCSSYKYQTYGYYVSLLASARGQRIMPGIASIRDFRILDVIKSAAYEVDELINESLDKVKGNTFSFNVYFGRTSQKSFNHLAMKLHQLFEAPLFRVSFLKHDKWLIKDIRILTYKSLPQEDLEKMYAFACKYFMSENHWQIYDWKSERPEKYGDSETLDVADVPDKILQTAKKAASLFGDGLFGVDLKMIDEEIYVVEVNDNPNIDEGVEDLVLKDQLYDAIIDSFIKRIETAKNIGKINFVNQ